MVTEVSTFSILLKQEGTYMESSWLIFQQMLVLIAMMAVGYFVYRKGWISEITEQQLSKMVVNIFNPALVISGVLGRTDAESQAGIFENMHGVLFYYIIVVALGYAGSWMIRPKRDEKTQYQLMFVFSNVGFMGIPVISALYGKNCVIYITFYILAYNLLLYTYGISVARKSGGSRTGTVQKVREVIRSLMNPGVAACIVAIVIFSLQIPMPDPAVTFFDYVGNTTIPLSMIIIGISVAKMSLKPIFSHGKMYLFCALKQLAVPVLAAVLFRPLFRDEMLFGIFVLMLSMPVGSIVTMISREYGSGETVCSQGIILSTLLSVITIPIVSLFLFPVF